MVRGREAAASINPSQGEPMFNPLEILNKEPVVIAGAVIAVINLLSLLNVLVLDADQLAALNTAMVAVLSLFVRAKVSPVA
jgi:hypothetical protein